MPRDDHAFSNHCERRKTIKARRTRQGAEEEKASGAKVRQEAQRRLGGSRRESETSAEAERAFRDHAGEEAASARVRPARRQSKSTETMPKRRQQQTRERD